MDVKNKRPPLFIFTALLIGTCIFLACYFSGFEHENQNAKNIIIAIVIIVVFLNLIWEPICFLFVSIDMAIWPPKLASYRAHQEEDEDHATYNRINFLKVLLKQEKLKMLFTESYRNKQLNQEYLNISRDLLLYIRYFIVLTIAVLVSRNELAYYNTDRLKRLFMFNQTYYTGLHEVYHLNQLYDFIASSLVDAFNYNNTLTWAHGSQSTMLGVVRLRQLLMKREQIGESDPEYISEPFMPGWQLPYQHLHYADKYWRVYDPWVPYEEKNWVSSTVLNFYHHGKLHKYPELMGYVSLLARSKQNSIKVLEFLTNYNWLSYNTSAVFMDFTLYNMDADMFSVCSLFLEQTPFGSTIPQVECDSIQLIGNMLETSYVSLIIYLVYTMTYMQFIQSFVTYVHYEPHLLFTLWFLVDLLIILLNVTVITLLASRVSLVTGMLARLEGANKLEFLDFRVPARLLALMNIMTGFLICCTTLRLWKLLRFAKVFQLFTTTLYMAWQSLAMTALVILIILLAFGMAVSIINGSYSIHFSSVLSSMTSLMAFAFGFRDKVKPQDMFAGSEIMAVLIYVSIGFVVSVVLVNVFSSLIHFYFLAAREIGEKKNKGRITILQFWCVHYNVTYNIISKILMLKHRRAYMPGDHTVAEDIDAKLEKRKMREKKSGQKEVELDEDMLQLKYRERQERTIATRNVMLIQMQILDGLLFDDVKWGKKTGHRKRRTFMAHLRDRHRTNHPS